jgi:DNA-binding transcriptional ArsR family regulator
MSTAPTEFPESLVPLFAALGDSTRLNVLVRLGDGRSRSIAELTEGTGLTRQGLSKHLTILERVGVIAGERLGRESRYAIRPGALDEVLRYLEQAARQWDDAIDRLQKHVEK